MLKAGVNGGSGAKNCRTASKRVRFGTDSAAATMASSSSKTTPPSNGDITNHSTVVSFVRQVRRVLRRRPDDYRDFATAVADILKATSEQEVEMVTQGRVTSSINVIDRIEKIISILDGHPGLVAGLAAILPSGFSIDVQPDAVVVKVFDADGDWSMVDTGHCRTNDDVEVMTSPIKRRTSSSSRRRQVVPRRTVPTSESASYHSDVVDAYNSSMTESSLGAPRRTTGLHDSQSTRRPTSATILGDTRVNRGGDRVTRTRTSPVRSRRPIDGSSSISRRSSRHRPDTAVTASDVVGTSASATLLRQLQARRLVTTTTTTTRTARNTKKTSSMSNSDGTAYLSDVKKALSRRPDVYRKFVEVLKRYHEQRASGNSSDGSSSVNRYGINGGMNDDGENHDLDTEIDDVDKDSSSTGGELETIREVVELLRTRPQLVLAFNDYLPDGYRIRMFDESAYVIEHPHTSVVTGAGGISAGIGRLTVTV